MINRNESKLIAQEQRNLKVRRVERTTQPGPRVDAKKPPTLKAKRG